MPVIKTACLVLILSASILWYHATGIAFVAYGREAFIGEFPWQVSIRGYSPSVHKCGGVIISDIWVLTSASCIKSMNILYPRIATATIDITRPGIIYKANMIFYHPDYDTYDHSNDIALVKTQFKMIFNQYVSPISLSNEPLAFNETCEIAGWGIEHFDGTSYSKMLRITGVTIIDREECRSIFAQENVQLGEDQFCARSDMGGACRGDEGGGFVRRYPSDVLLGLISTNFCTLDNFPTAFVDVYLHREWISNTTGIQFPDHVH
ncbi:trypsin alpha-like [Cloeon dipterum]|uniref:trypsin alpha-like n=1 Tax=Cloeon dipterum TaxID=197152 RepID=UPI00321F7415